MGARRLQGWGILAIAIMAAWGSSVLSLPTSVRCVVWFAFGVTTVLTYEMRYDP